MSLTRDTLTFVCTGNTCRSPMAAALMAHALAAESPPLNALRTTSAGLAAASGQPASPNATTALRQVGLHLHAHSSQPLTQAHIDRSAAIFCMTRHHLTALTSQFSLPPDLPVCLMRDLLPETDERDIPDPYGQNLDAYTHTRDHMVEALPHLLRFLREKLPPTP